MRSVTGLKMVAQIPLIEHLTTDTPPPTFDAFGIVLTMFLTFQD